MTARPLTDHLAGWQPEAVVETETIDAEPSRSFARLLDQPSPVARHGDALPPLWHWLHFLPTPAQEDLGADGHPRAGAFLPPIPERRRMFAGGRLTVHRPVRCGQTVTRHSSLIRDTIKRGSTGELLFVTVRHVLTAAGEALAVEEQDLVYRSGSATAASMPPPEEPAPVASPWQLAFQADPVLLFRFSALTGNAHRIHYDLLYATEVEGFPALVVHGPLLALLLLELPRRHAQPGHALTAFAFRARRPLYSGQTALLHGDPAGTLEVARPHAGPAMTATFDLRA